MRTCIHAYTLKHTESYTCICMHAYTCKHTHMLTHKVKLYLHKDRRLILDSSGQASSEGQSLEAFGGQASMYWTTYITRG